MSKMYPILLEEETDSIIYQSSSTPILNLNKKKFDKDIMNWQSNIIEYHILPDEDMLFLKLENKIPGNLTIDSYANNNLLCLNYTKNGGMWRIKKISDDCLNIYCAVLNKIEVFEWEIEKGDLTIENTANMRIVKKKNPDFEDGGKTRKPCVFFATPLIAHARVTVFSINSIDTANQCFQADIYVEFRLRGICSTAQDATAVEQFLAIADFSASKVELVGVQEEKSMQTYCSISSGINAGWDYMWKCRYKVVLAERMELGNFPFDQQLLNICLTVNKPNGCFTLMENTQYRSKFLEKDFIFDSAFKVVFGSTVVTRVYLSEESESSSGYRYPRINFSILLERKPHYYICNVIFPMAIISFLALCSFSYNSDGTELATNDRLGITLTMLLTAVAYKFVVASALPILSYNTLLDKYVLACFIFILLVSAENAIYPILAHRLSYSQKFERNIGLGLCLMFLSANILYFYLLRRAISVREEKTEIKRPIATME